MLQGIFDEQKIYAVMHRKTVWLQYHAIGDFSQHTACRRLFLRFHIPRCSSLCQKTVRWYLGNCRLWGREPDSTRALAVSRGGGGVTMCQPTSHHTGLPARPRSPDKSVLIMDRMTNSSLSHMQSAVFHTDGGTCVIQPSNHDVSEFVGRFRDEDLMSVDTVKTPRRFAHDRTGLRCIRTWKWMRWRRIKPPRRILLIAPWWRTT